MAARRPLIVGNWKMNGLTASLAEASALAGKVKAQAPAAELGLCPPATLVAAMAAALKGTGIGVGGQDCHAKASGAHTGDISAEALKDAGAIYVLAGHSERRTDHAETDATVRAKAQAAHRAGLIAIVCLGETLAQRDANETLKVVSAQLRGSLPDDATAANTVVAYEPVWAIGTGRTPTEAQVAEVHAAMRQELKARFDDGEGFRLLYGGSVKPDNAKALMAVADVDGALVGGASLKANDFWPIIEAKGFK
ncbi:triose-phosphate isomerase [Ferrovibrio terrae]|uniref:Triosephosphate isomerase n=1 Tax=Ferrovibrio terrae TaxID=2594003 RepID=A0A516H3Y5_9PROT|nr:triose-phosphate isomerase [Ferrovibrio terrae]QDO98481.1 triose-phosphate isomerase [Ferrovibrio terrae]